ncbi:MAG: LLM class flavin-dependent oxidoreductase [Gammaproteobacteria bacterium]|nr:LLM class flavin-dependent oxidoreductase [Gammaproteobacteria bacterium]
MNNFQLSVVDQAPIHGGGPDSLGIRDSVRLAQACDAAGYHRYWLAEHHNTPGYASPCPEVLVGHIAQATRRIRVGTGGVMLTHYSPYKVAETFRMLSVLHPDRIDLGLGRAPGGSPLTSAALSHPRPTIDAEQAYPQQVADLMGYLGDTLPPEHPLAAAKVVPKDGGNPEIWLLGSAAGSSGLAAELGAGFVLALFIGTHDRPAEIIHAYQRSFRPNALRDKPAAGIAVATICAETEQEAQLIASTHTLWKVFAFRHGQIRPLLPPAQALDTLRGLSESDQAYFEETLNTMVVGTPEQCRTELEALADTYSADEVFVVNVTYDFEPRLRSYELLAKAFDLSG